MEQIIYFSLRNTILNEIKIKIFQFMYHKR